MTEAGKRLLTDLTVNSAGEAAFETVHPYWVAHLTAQIAAIEAEATAAAEQRLRDSVKALPEVLEVALGYSVVRRTDVLRLLAALLPTQASDSPEKTT